MREIEFGYYPIVVEWEIGEIGISTHSSIKDSIQLVESDGGVDADWIFSPDCRRRAFPSGAESTLPYKNRVFGLPKTHTIRHRSAMTDEHLTFLVWVLGFLVGMRLTVTEAGFLDSTPIKPGKLHDIVWQGRSLETALCYAELFWQQHKTRPEIQRVIIGIIHSYFLSQARTLLSFERFVYLYIALDACYKALTLLKKATVRKRVPHGERVESLCQEFGMSIPAWADPEQSEIASVRNDTLHEGLFFGEPLGFNVYGCGEQKSLAGNQTLLQMTKLVSRFVLAILDIPAQDYVISSIHDRQRFVVKLDSLPNNALQSDCLQRWRASGNR